MGLPPSPDHIILPKRIILVRHGESQGNQDEKAYTTTPDNQIPLSPHGIEQARHAGERILRVVSEDGCSQNWKVYFYVSPYQRTLSTLREIGKSFPRDRILGVREECRIREQDFGNFQVQERMKDIKSARQRFGRFFYRFPEGESAADVFNRLSGHRYEEACPPSHCDDEINLIIVTHGLTLRVFLMKWFKWTVEEFKHLYNSDNCESLVIQLGDGGEYSLAIHHSEKELVQWGLSTKMIADQKWRTHGNWKDWNKFSCCLDTFFDRLPSLSSSSYSDDSSNGPCDQDGEKENNATTKTSRRGRRSRI